MTQPTKVKQPKQAQAAPAPREDALKPKEKAEQGEVAGRHKNDGQKFHKGAV
jgi:hypothetical protein